MKKIIVVGCILVISLLTGCGLVERFRQAEEQYLETRIAELLEEMQQEELASPQPVSTEEGPVEEPTVEPTQAETAVLPTGEVTEEPQEEATPEPTKEPSLEPTIESDDPGVYLGEPDWLDDMSKAEFWPTGVDDMGYMSAEFENGTYRMRALSEISGWRIASTSSLKNAYIEASFKIGECSQTDGYGFIFRVPDPKNPVKGYLYGLTCDGQFGLRAWDGTVGESGQTTWLKYYATHGAVRKGKDQTNRLGVMAIGDRIILFVNGEKVFEVTNDTYGKGNFGVYINRDRTEKLTVTVDDVKYWLDPELK